MTLNTWNYRVIEFEHEGEKHRAVHEVYYDDQGHPTTYTENPAVIFATEEDGFDLKTELSRFERALAKPVLKAENFSDGN